jgi:hypothetical protein
VLKRDEWEWTLQELREDDIRGLPQAQFHDPERKARKKKRARVKKAPPRPLSWIWVTRGERWEAGDDAAMNEGTAVCWRARSWAEIDQQLYASNGPRREHGRCAGRRKWIF